MALREDPNQHNPGMGGTTPRDPWERLPRPVLRRLKAAAAMYRRGWFDGFWERRIRRLAHSDSGRRVERPGVHLYAPCRNEQRILPYFMAHYGPFVDRFFIYDNMSTDATRALLAGYPNVEIVSLDTGGQYAHVERERMKNHAWKASAGKADFVLVCDVDEFLYHPHLDVLLALMKRHGYTVLRPHGYQMACEKLPEFDGTPITARVQAGMDVASHYSKRSCSIPIACGTSISARGAIVRGRRAASRRSIPTAPSCCITNTSIGTKSCARREPIGRTFPRKAWRRGTAGIICGATRRSWPCTTAFWRVRGK